MLIGEPQKAQAVFSFEPTLSLGILFLTTNMAAAIDFYHQMPFRQIEIYDVVAENDLSLYGYRQMHRMKFLAEDRLGFGRIATMVFRSLRELLLFLFTWVNPWCCTYRA